MWVVGVVIVFFFAFSKVSLDHALCVCVYSCGCVCIYDILTYSRVHMYVCMFICSKPSLCVFSLFIGIALYLWLFRHARTG